MSKGSCLQTWTTITLFSREKTKHYQSKQSYVPRSAGAAACSKPHVTAPSRPRARTLLNPRPLFWARLQVNAWRLNALTDEAKARQLNCLRADSRTGQDAPQLSLLMGWSPAPSLEGHTWSSSRHFVPGTTAQEGSFITSHWPASPTWFGKYEIFPRPHQLHTTQRRLCRTNQHRDVS